MNHDDTVDRITSIGGELPALNNIRPRPIGDGPADQAAASMLHALTVDAAGVIYWPDGYNCYTIRMCIPTPAPGNTHSAGARSSCLDAVFVVEGRLCTLAGCEKPGLADGRGVKARLTVRNLVADPFGYIWFTDAANAVRRVTPDGNSHHQLWHTLL